jgi:phosphoglycolate phosphatase
MNLVIFDVDGTLIDSQQHIVAAMTAAFEGENRPVPDRASILSIVGLSLPVAIDVLVPGLDPAVNARLVAAYKAHWTDAARLGPPPLYPGASQVLAGLAARGDVVMGIATGKSRKGLDTLIEAHGWQGYFVTQQVSDNHPSKPHPSMVLAALAETGVPAGRAVMVGDTEFDMQMAASAGVLGIGVDWGYHPPERVGAPHRVAEFAELPRLLHLLWGQA